MASTCFSPISISGGSQLKARELFSSKSMSFAKTPMLTVQRKSYGLGSKRNLSVRAEYEFLSFSGMNFSVVVHSLAAFDHMNDNSSGGGGGDFFAGFLLGGAVFGTLAYVFAPQIRRSLLNEDEYGFRKARRPIYDYDEGLEKTRQTLNKKISQLNSAIDNVSSRLRGGKNNAPPTIAIESDPEVEATM